jgi:hypothetical protein
MKKTPIIFGGTPIEMINKAVAIVEAEHSSYGVAEYNLLAPLLKNGSFFRRKYKTVIVNNMPMCAEAHAFIKTLVTAEKLAVGTPEELVAAPNFVFITSQSPDGFFDADDRRYTWVDVTQELVN